VKRALDGFVSTLTDLGRSRASDASLTSGTDWNAVQRRVAARNARVTASCGGGPLPADQAQSEFRRSLELTRSEIETRNREYQSCVQQVGAEFDRQMLGVAGATTLQPMLGAQPAPVNAGLGLAVDTIMNAGTGADNSAPKRIPFEYEMPRTSRPDRDFLKRVSGELRSTKGQHELSINVSDIDRNWLTTGECVTLDVSFQLTMARSDGARAFPVFVVPIAAGDGTADLRVPVPLNEAGEPTDIRVTSARARACGSPVKEPVSCDNWRAERDTLFKQGDVLLKKTWAFRDGIETLTSALDDFKDERTLTESALLDWLVTLSAAGDVAQTYLIFAGVASPAMLAVEIGRDLAQSAEEIYALAVSGNASADEVEGTARDVRDNARNFEGLLKEAATVDERLRRTKEGQTAAEWLLKGPPGAKSVFDVGIFQKLNMFGRAFRTMSQGPERAQALSTTRRTMSLVTGRLRTQLSQMQKDLELSNVTLRSASESLVALQAACGPQRPQ
jgi:hypothetical protein